MLDAGQTDGGGVLAARVACPGEVLLSLDGPPGLSGRRETAAFADLPAMPSSVTGRLCDLAVRHVVAGAAGGDFSLFAGGLTEFGLIVGEFFRDAQGGRFVDVLWEDRLVRLRSAGDFAVAQSSWGPTVAVICRDVAATHDVRRLLPDVNWTQARPVPPSGG